MSPSDPTTPVERLERLLGLLRTDPPEPDGTLSGRIVRSARWQRPVRLVLEVGGRIGVGLAGGLASVSGLRRPSP